MDLHVLWCPDHGFNIYTKYLSFYDTDFVAELEQKMVDRIVWNSIFSCILVWTTAD